VSTFGTELSHPTCAHGWDL